MIRSLRLKHKRASKMLLDLLAGSAVSQVMYRGAPAPKQVQLTKDVHARRQDSLAFSLRCANFMCLVSLFAFGLVAISLSSVRVMLGYPRVHSSVVTRRGLDPHELNRTLFLEAVQDPWTPEELDKLNLLLEDDVGDLERVKRRWQRDILGRAANIDMYYQDHRPRSGRRISSRARLPLELTHPRYSTHWSQSSQALHSWLRRKRYDPSVMNQLVELIKAPIDRQQKARLNTSIEQHEESRRYKKCAVVGNSGILLNSEYGSFIDSHEAVVRLNNARVSGFESRVGSKTTLSFINSNVLALCSKRPGCHCHPYGSHVPIVVYMCQALHFVHLKLCGSLMPDSPLLVTDPRLDVLCMRIVKYYSLKIFFQSSKSTSTEDWKRLHDGSFFHYSSGMQAVILALGLCDRVNIFGYGKSAAAKHHYHTNQRGELNLHDYAAEYALYQDLANNRSIPFLSGAGFKLPAVQVFS